MLLDCGLLLCIYFFCFVCIYCSVFLMSENFRYAVSLGFNVWLLWFMIPRPLDLAIELYERLCVLYVFYGCGGDIFDMNVARCCCDFECFETFCASLSARQYNYFVTRFSRSQGNRFGYFGRVKIQIFIFIMNAHFVCWPWLCPVAYGGNTMCRRG